MPDDRLMVVGFSGLPGSGKNHMAGVLYREHGFVPMTLALPFKVEAVALHGFPYQEVFGSTKGPATRNHLRIRGTENGRDILGEDIWVKHADVLLSYYRTFGINRFAFTDVRFPNEAAYIHRLGGKLVLLEGGKDDLPNGHRSESYYDQLPYDARLSNAERNYSSESRVIGQVWDFWPNLRHRPNRF